jgi:hypothetical protein
MQNAVQILQISFLVGLVLIAIVIARLTFVGYVSVFTRSQFSYRFDKTRLPRCGYTFLAVMGACLIYASIIAGNIGGGVGFCIVVSPFAALGCLLSVCYVPRSSTKG